MDIIFPHEVADHKNRDDTWEMADDEIEDKIKELRREIYRLQKSRSKQPKLLVVRKSAHGTGPVEAHIFDGWQIMDLEKCLFRADSWHRIRQHEADFLKKHYSLTDRIIEVINETLKKGDKHA